METFLALTTPTDVEPHAPLNENPEAVEPAMQESVESLREALRSAQLRVAYFERFGPWVEQQMAAVVERATAIEKESELRRNETTTEIAALRAEVAEEVASARRDAEHERKSLEAEFKRRREEIEELKAECDRKRDEAAQTIARAHATADFVMGKLSGSASEIVQRALGDMETLRAGLTPEALAAKSQDLPVEAVEAVAEPAAEPEPEPVEDNRRGWFRGRK
jgi:chromosome segregation ATPase